MATDPPAVPDEDSQAIVDVLIERASERLSWQNSASDSIDSKALAALALAAVAIGTLAAVATDIRYWWVPSVVMVIGAFPLGYVAWPSSFEVGRDLTVFYEEYGGLPRLEFTLTLLSDILDAEKSNSKGLAEKSRALKFGVVILTVGLAAIVVVGLVHRY